jgi:hypothetical protein
MGDGRMGASATTNPAGRDEWTRILGVGRMPNGTIARTGERLGRRRVGGECALAVGSGGKAGRGLPQSKTLARLGEVLVSPGRRV